MHKSQRSPAAEQKALSKRTDDGFTVESFRSILSLLGTIVKNWLRPRGTNTEAFTMITTPNAHQRRALDLLDITLRS